MGTTYQINLRNETEENPHIIVFDPDADPNAFDPSSVWRTLDLPVGHSVPITFTTDHGILRVAGTGDGRGGNRRAKSRPAADPSTIKLEGVQSADLVVRGNESKGYSFALENVRRG